MDDVQSRETTGTVELAVELTAAVWFAGSIGHTVYAARTLHAFEMVAMVVVAVMVVLGEQLLVRVTGSLTHVPVATAAGLALATTGVFGTNHLLLIPPSVLIVLVSLAAAAGAAIRCRRERTPLDLYGLSVQVHMVTLASVLFRWVPLGGATLLDVSARDKTPWVAALILTGLVTLALLLGVVLGAMHVSSSAGLDVVRIVGDELEVLWYLHVTTMITTVTMALGARVLGPWAYPAMVMPLLLVQFAMRRNAVVQQTKRETVRALATLPEVGGYVAVGHVSRVADLATSIGRALKLSERELLVLEHAAQLHDVGQVGLRIPLPGGATVEAAPRDQQAIASNGARILAEAGDGQTVLTIVEMQSASYRRMRELGEEIPLASRILKVANAFDDFAQGRRDARFRETAVERLSLGLGYEYDPAVFEALLTVLGASSGRSVSGRR